MTLLVSIGNELKLFSQDVNSSDVQSTARNFASSLRDGSDDFKENALQLHRWLIAPIENWLNNHHVQTLVIVPDGVLRLIPMAALYDGSHFLIEHYALATSPGLTVIEPIPIHQVGVKSLLVGFKRTRAGFGTFTD